MEYWQAFDTSSDLEVDVDAGAGPRRESVRLDRSEPGLLELNMNERLLREYVKQILTEAACPGCGDKDAYIGLSAVECPNESCKFFSRRQQIDVDAAADERTEFDDSEEDADEEECDWCGADITGNGGHCDTCDDGDVDKLRILAMGPLDHCGMCGLKAVDPDTGKCTNCSAGHYPDCTACGGAVDNPTACQNCGHPS